MDGYHKLALAMVLFLPGCGATYTLTSPQGWTASVHSYRDVDSAKISLNDDGQLSIDVQGVNSSRAIEQANASLISILQALISTASKAAIP